MVEKRVHVINPFNVYNTFRNGTALSTKFRVSQTVDEFLSADI